MSLDVAPLGRAVMRLREGIARYEQDTSDEQIRDGLVQRFEYTYELSHRLLKRFMEQSAASPKMFDQMAFADLIRSANEQGLLRSDWPKWRGFRDMRARTSHTYNVAIANQVVAAIPEFLCEADALWAELTRRTA